MSLFRKPKKTIQRRVFMANDEGDAENNSNNDEMDIDEPTPQITSSINQTIKKEKKKDKNKKSDDTKSKKSLLSFADDEDEGEVFQVKKSSHSKKMMRMLDKERRRKKHLKDDNNKNNDNDNKSTINKNSNNNSSNNYDQISSSSSSTSTQNKNNKNSDCIQTEIRTDDFVLVVKKSEPENVILNGRAALCAGRDDMSSEDEEDNNETENHRFAKPDNFKLVLESGSIPDAAMIHAARKRRQKAREQGDFIPIEEQTKEIRHGKRLVREENDDDGSDEEERVDMNAITGIKEIEERREKFYSVQNEYSGDDSDLETNEWENQQIRKGVTGAQLVTAVQGQVLSQFVIKPSAYIDDNIPQSTATLLEQAYAKNCLEKPRQILLSTQNNESKPSGPRNPQEINDTVRNRLIQLKQLNNKHLTDIERIIQDLRNAKIEALECTQKAPAAAAKYRFYQELRGYVTDLVECLDEKAPKLIDVEKRVLQVFSKHANYLIERRRQDVRDQAKEISDLSKPSSSSTKKDREHEEHVRRTAAREGRRTRRRFEREKNEFMSSHLDGMSSDDERPDQDVAQYNKNLDQLEVEVDDLFADTRDEFCKIENILLKFEIWRNTDMDSYKEAFVSLCLPKIIGPLVRVQLLRWYPLEDRYQEIEKMDWYAVCMRYGFAENETEDSLARDPDVRFVPTLIEKIVLPKLTEIIENCWDPLSTSQTLRLIGLINRLGRDYPSLRESSKSLQTLFNSILDKIKSSLDNDVFIPIFPSKIQEAKSSFFQRQFCSGLKLFRNILSWQGVIADKTLIELAISSLLNRYLLSAMRVCTQQDAIAKANLVVNTLPTAWLQPDSSVLESLVNFIAFVKYILEQLDKKNPLQISMYEKAKQTLQRLHCY